MSFSNYTVEIVSVAIGTAFLSIYYVFVKESRKLPPYTKHNFFQVIYNLTGSKAPHFLQECSKDQGTVFCVSMPEIAPFVIVGDPGLARRIYEEVDQKPALYKRSDGITLGIRNIFSKATHGIMCTII